MLPVQGKEAGSIIGWGTKIRATRQSQKKKKKAYSWASTGNSPIPKSDSASPELAPRNLPFYRQLQVTFIQEAPGPREGKH